MVLIWDKLLRHLTYLGGGIAWRDWENYKLFKGLDLTKMVWIELHQIKFLKMYLDSATGILVNLLITGAALFKTFHSIVSLKY